MTLVDIESLGGSGEVRPPRHSVGIRAKQQRQAEAPNVESFIPSAFKVHVRTWGCTHNTSDSEYMSGLLSRHGFQLTPDSATAHLLVLNSCTVKTPAEHHLMNEITRARERGQYVIAAGCVPQADAKAPFLRGVSVLGVQQLDRVVEAAEHTLAGCSVSFLSQKRAGVKAPGAPLDLPKIRKNPLVEIIAINTGCLNQCTYCKTQHARGVLRSYPVAEIVARARSALSEGVVELWITSEDTGAYGRDIGTTLPELLRVLVLELPEGTMLRLGMTNPPYILDHLPAIVEILNHPRVYAFLHLPVQSGSDSVLMDMRREYCAADFRRVVEYLVTHVPNVSIATDLICGFPTELDSDFEETLSLVRDYHFPSVFINQFFPRPGTPAARMPQIDKTEVKRRTKAASELFRSYTTYDRHVGERQCVLVTELSFDEKHYVGHNKAYQQVLVPLRPELLGKQVEVLIVDATKHSLRGELLPANVSPLQSRLTGDSGFYIFIVIGLLSWLLYKFSFSL